MDTFGAICQRRAVKQYDPTHELTEDGINKLFETVIQSPTSFNMQNWRFVLVRDKALRAKIPAASPARSRWRM
jgi:nitroreductase